MTEIKVWIFDLRADKNLLRGRSVILFLKKSNSTSDFFREIVKIVNERNR